MKKQLIATMAVVVSLAGSVTAPAQAAGICNTVQFENDVMVKGKLCNVSDVRNSLEEWCQQIVNGSENNCSFFLLPDCNPFGKPENSQPEQGDTDVDLPEVEQPEQGDTDVDIPEVEHPEQDNSGNQVPEVDTEHLSYAEQIVVLVNEERVKAGLKPVEMDGEISSAALIRSQEIKTLFSHTRPDGRSFHTVLTEKGIRFSGAGENIAWGQKSPEQVMSAWMNSEGHRANILNANYTKLGVGHFQDTAGTNYWVQLFTY